MNATMSSGAGSSGGGFNFGGGGPKIIKKDIENQDVHQALVELSDGRRMMAKRLGRDFSRGLALLKIEATGLSIPEPARKDRLKPGRLVLATGRTFGPNLPASSLGIISAINRLGGRAVQTDANLSPSCYGGALIDLHGRIIGVLAPLSPKGFAAGIQWYDSGIGFAPTWTGILEIIPLLRQGKDLHPGKAGIALDPGFTGPGALIGAPKTRRPGSPSPKVVTSPAKKAGLQPGDLIVEMGGVQIRHLFHLQDLLASHYAGDKIAFTVNRKGKLLSVRFALEKRSMATPMPKLPFPFKLPGKK